MTDAQDLPDVLLLEEDMGSIRRARDHVRQSCHGAGLDPRTCETAVLLTSEVVTNALVHAHSAPRLGVSVGVAGLRVEVGDDDPVHPGPVAQVEPSAYSGRGLGLVATLADDWGITSRDAGKVVWFSLGR